MSEPTAMPKQAVIVIGQFSYIDNIGFGRVLTNMRETLKDVHPPNQPGNFLEIVPRAFYDGLLNQLQDMERIHHFKDELLRLSHIDHSDVDELLFRGATTAPSEEMAVYMTQLLAARMVTTMRHGSYNEERRLGLLYRLSQEDHMYEEVGIQATARMLVMFTKDPALHHVSPPDGAPMP